MRKAKPRAIIRHMDAATGVLSGAPTVRGIYNFAVRATDSFGCTGQRPYQILVN